MIAIIANPNALRFDSEKLKQVKLILESHGYNVDVYFTQRAGDGTLIADRISKNYRVIAAYGGDGIVNEIVNAPLRLSALAILPAGTTNVMALNLGIPRDPCKAARVIIDGHIRRAFTGRINGRRFLLMAGVGFDGTSVFMVNQRLKKKCGKLAYVAAGINAYFRAKHDTLDIEIGSERFRARWVIVSKIRKYAGNFTLSTSVDFDKPLFDVLMFSSFANATVELPVHNALLFGGLHRYKFVPAKHVITDKTIRISAAHVQIDGDYFGYTKSTIELDSKPINLIAP